MESTTAKKDTTLDLREKANRLKAEIERQLVESHGVVNEEIDQKMDELNDLMPDVKEKIEGLRWAKKQVEAQVEATKASEKFWKEEAKKVRKTRDAREKNIDHIKNLVLMNLNTLESRDIRLSDGNKVYIREFFSANVEDEPAAWADLRKTDIAEKQAVLASDGVDQVKDAILSTLEFIQTENGEPKSLPTEIHTKLMSALKILNKAEVQYSFDGRALNSEVQRLHEERQKKLKPVMADLQSKKHELDELLEEYKPNGENDPELDGQVEQLKAEIDDLHDEADVITKEHSISGVTYDINESVFGL